MREDGARGPAGSRAGPEELARRLDEPPAGGDGRPGPGTSHRAGSGQAGSVEPGGDDGVAELVLLAEVVRACLRPAVPRPAFARDLRSRLTSGGARGSALGAAGV